MSQLIKTKSKCVVCGKEHEYNVLYSAYTNGEMDFDTRPKSIGRNNFLYSIQYCDNCHYCNDNIEELIDNFNKDILKANNYLKLANDNTINLEAKKFILAGYLQYICGDYQNAGYHYLYAAWVFDDLNQNENAIKVRKKAFKYLNEYVDETADLDMAVLMVDLERRIGEFQDAIEDAKSLLEYGVDELLEKILNKEIVLCENCDSLCHSIDEE